MPPVKAFLALSLVFLTVPAIVHAELCRDQLLPGPVSESGPVDVLVMTKHWPARSKMQKEILRELPDNVHALLLDDRSGAVSSYDRYADLPKDEAVNTLAAHSPSNWVHDYLPELIINGEGVPTLVHFAYASPSDYEADAAARFLAELFGRRSAVKAKPFPLNGLVARSLADFLQMPLVRSEIVLHGGHYIAGDDGAVFLSEDVIYKNSVDNLELTERLRSLLGAREIVWLPRIFREPTGHLDVYAMYLGSKEFILQKTAQTSHWNTEVERAAQKLIARGYNVNYVITPDPKRLYVNSRRVGTTLFMPVYAPRSLFGKVRLDEFDLSAKKEFEKHGLNVVPIHANELIDKMGSLHCLTKTYRCNF